MTQYFSLPQLRYKAYRLACRVFLGKLCGGALGSNICRDVEEGLSKEVVPDHVEKRIELAPAEILSYPFPEDFPPLFPRSVSFDTKFLYQLSDVVLAPHSGLMWLPKGPIFQQSMGSLGRVFGGGVQETLCKAHSYPCEEPCCVLGCHSYYHFLCEDLPPVLRALQCVPSVRIVVPPKRPRYIDNVLETLKIESERLIESESPVRVPHAVLVPKWVNGGFVQSSDMAILRKKILPILSKEKKFSRVFVSRTHCSNRPTPGEKELETTLTKKGFHICYFEEMAWKAQLEAIYHADIIVATHGAGLANLVVGRPRQRILEVLSPDWYNTCYAKIAVQLGMEYRYLRMKAGPDTRSRPKYGIDPAAVVSSLAPWLNDA